MNSSIKNALIGLFALIASGIILFMLLFLHPTVGDDGKRLRVLFTNIDKVNVGTRVTYAGHPVGEVIGLMEVPDARRGKVAKNGEIYVYELILEVDSSVNVFNTDQVSVQTSGLLGERNVEITPRAPAPNQELMIVNDTLLYAVPAGSMEGTLNRVDEIAKQFSTLLQTTQEVVSSLQKEDIPAHLGDTARHIASLASTLDQPQKWSQSIDRLSSLLDRAHHSWDRADETIQNFSQISQQATKSWEKVDQSLDTMAAALQKTENLLENLHQGKGTLGQLLQGDDLYVRLKTFMYKGETIFDDIKQFGLLFQLDKRWQRLQAKRLQLLQKLSSPEAFSAHFEESLNRMELSLANVTYALQEAEQTGSCLAETALFQERFKKLLQETTQMEETLNLYLTSIKERE